jgi:hypothetical protein
MKPVSDAICYADSARGIYIPQYVAETIRRDMVKYVSDEDWAILESGPDHPDYWEAWDSFLNNAETTDGAIFWQNGDLWMIYADDARQAVNDYCQAQLEYEESHKDAGDNYSHLPAESWTSTDESALRAYLIAQDIDCHGLDIDTIADIVLDNFRMYAGSIYGAYDLPDDAFILAAYPVQEIEIDLSGIGLDGITLEYIRDSCDAYIKGDLAYMTTDAVWFTAIKRDYLQECIRDYAESHK